MNCFKWQEFIPESYRALKDGYTLFLLKKDLMAGITIGVIAIPMALAFAISSGVTPQQGLYTAIIGGFLVALLGGSRVQIGGPTAFFAVTVYTIIQKTGYQNLCISMLIAGVLLITAGFFKIGNWIKYIPTSTIIGCTCGIAVTIFVLQIPDFLGLKIESNSASFIGKWISYYNALPSLNPHTAFLGLGSLALIAFLRSKMNQIPWGLTVIALGILICFFFDLPIATIDSKFGKLPTRLPYPAFPNFEGFLGEFPLIIKNAFVIAILIASESLISALIGDGLLGRRPRSNCELVAQGIANIGVALFGGIPESGSVPRTSANVETGAKTPIAGIVHALTLLLTLCVFSNVLSKIPLVSLASVLMVVAYCIFEVKLCIPILKASYGDRLILLTTFALTVLFDIQTAIFTGALLSAIFFIHKISQKSTIVPSQTNYPIFSNTKVYELHGPLFFGTINLLQEISFPKFLILDMQFVSLIDTSGMFAFKDFYKECQQNQTHLFLSGIQGITKKDFERLGLDLIVEKESIFPDVPSAIAQIKESP